MLSWAMVMSRVDWGGGGSASKLVHGATGRSQVLSGYWLETLVSCHVELSIGLFEIWQPDTAKVRNLREEQAEIMVFSQPNLGNGSHLPILFIKMSH